MGLIRHGDLTIGKAKEASTGRGLRVSVERGRKIDASNSRLFALLSDPQALAGLLPRVKKVEVIQRGEASARVATHVAVSPFTTVRSEGEVRWQQDQEVVFLSRQPVIVESRWSFSPSGQGTDVRVSLTVDLSPLLGPMAAMVRREHLEAMIAPDLDAALSALGRRFGRA